MTKQTPFVQDLSKTMTDAGQAMARAVEELSRRNDVIEKQGRLITRMRNALIEIEARAQDNYDGPEDRTHGPYLGLAQEGLGIHP